MSGACLAPQPGWGMAAHLQVEQCWLLWGSAPTWCHAQGMCWSLEAAKGKGLLGTDSCMPSAGARLARAGVGHPGAGSHLDRLCDWACPLPPAACQPVDAQPAGLSPTGQVGCFNLMRVLHAAVASHSCHSLPASTSAKPAALVCVPFVDGAAPSWSDSNDLEANAAYSMHYDFSCCAVCIECEQQGKTGGGDCGEGESADDKGLFMCSILSACSCRSITCWALSRYGHWIAEQALDPSQNMEQGLQQLEAVIQVSGSVGRQCLPKLCWAKHCMLRQADVL